LKIEEADYLLELQAQDAVETIIDSFDDEGKAVDVRKMVNRLHEVSVFSTKFHYH